MFKICWTINTDAQKNHPLSIRIRDLNTGEENPVGRVYGKENARKEYERLSKRLKPFQTRGELETLLTRVYGGEK